MSKSDTTHFHFDFGGITLELSGERTFVEKMYKQVMRDVAEARSQAPPAAAPAQSGSKGRVQAGPARRRSVWVHRCSELMRKIYMATPADVSASVVGKVIDSEPVAVIYVDKDAFGGVFPQMDDGQTLWAEFTAAGKEKVAEATRPSLKALSPDVLRKPGQG
ncbi:hypothetical protein DL240_04720 [Lujinxingia litoralis]|uniref:Uncharacterized protein n=1 Tax=Lujinxingia litoralis TaxID=2211119 RepID=A0A328CA53_9DELT|nr:hypothetical protein [Lujinxingia litoralis]RAL25517.1 hypothetical protein DL240_04720 [Lujinxingia litoralis]